MSLQFFKTVQRLFSFWRKTDQRDADAAPPLPKVGDYVYIPTQLYISHGEDDRQGGRTTVVKVEPNETGDDGWIVTAFDTAEKSRWSYLAPLQAKLRDEFGDAPPKATPDYRPEFNRWD